MRWDMAQLEGLQQVRPMLHTGARPLVAVHFSHVPAWPPGDGLCWLVMARVGVRLAVHGAPGTISRLVARLVASHSHSQ
jgi:hypothetical protein